MLGKVTRSPCCELTCYRTYTIKYEAMQYSAIGNWKHKILEKLAGSPTAAAEPGSPELEGDSLRTQKPTHHQHGPWAHLDEQEPGPLLPISNPFQSGALYTDAQLIHFSHSFAFICYISLDFLFLWKCFPHSTDSIKILFKKNSALCFLNTYLFKKSA